MKDEPLKNGKGTIPMTLVIAAIIALVLFFVLSSCKYIDSFAIEACDGDRCIRVPIKIKHPVTK